MGRSVKRESWLPGNLEASVLLALAPHELPAGTAAALKKRILTRLAGDAADSLRTVRAGAGVWKKIAAGVALQVLHDDGAGQSWLVRMAAGARLPAHAHPGDEECLVVKGSCRLGEIFLREGDYQLARKGSRHGDVVSEAAGCVLFVRSSARIGSAAA